MLVAALTAALALASSAQPPPALVVRASDSADAVRLASALAERMPAVRVVQEGAQAGADDLAVGLAPKDEAWVLTVERRGGLALERTMPAGASGPDSAFFVACAAVVERYLQDIDWKGKPEAIDPSALAQPKQPPEVISLPVPVDWSVGAAASGAAEIGGDGNPWRGGPAVDVTVRRGSLLGALRAQLNVPESRKLTVARRAGEEQTGWVDDLSASVSVLGGGCKGQESSLCGGVQLGWRGTWAWGNGRDTNLFQWQMAQSDAFLAGLFAAFSYRLPARLELRVLLTGSVFLGDAGFHVDGVQTPAWTPPQFALGLSLGLARRVP